MTEHEWSGIVYHLEKQMDEKDAEITTLKKRVLLEEQRNAARSGINVRRIQGRVLQMKDERNPNRQILDKDEKKWRKL